MSSQPEHVQAQAQTQKQSFWQSRWLAPFLPTITALLLLVLVLPIPWLLTRPFIPVVWSINYIKPLVDPDAVMRQQFLLLALGIFCFSLVLTVVLRYVVERRITHWVMVQYALMISVLALAIRAYPYWVNGIYKAFSQPCGSSTCPYPYNSSFTQPFTWPIIGEVWGSLSFILIMGPVIFISSLYVLVSTISHLRAASTRKNRKQQVAWMATLLVVLILLALVVVSYVLTPGHDSWTE